MKIIVALILCFLAFTSHAQAITSIFQPDSTIQVTVLRQGRYSRVIYTINHKQLAITTVKTLLNRYPPAAAKLCKGRVRTRWALGLVPVMVVALLVGKHQADQQKDMLGSAFSKAPVPLSIFLGSFVGYSYLLFSNNHFGKAIEAYNQRFY